MEQFGKEEFEKLSLIKEKICASIYLSTHESGMEVNAGVDKVSFKSEIQKIKNTLEKMDLPVGYITQFLAPAINLLENEKFWKDQLRGLAVFIKENGFLSYRLPIQVKTWSTVSPMFDLTPLLPLLKEDIYYTLALSQNKTRLFKNTAFTYEEIDISDLVPENTKEVLAFYGLENENKGESMVGEKLRKTTGKGPLASHTGAPQDVEYLYTMEFLRGVNKGVVEKLKEDKAPLIVAAVDNVHSMYKEVNTYKNFINEGVFGNPDYSNERTLHEKSYNLVKEKFNRSKKNDLEKYTVWAGTGKTSYQLEEIINAAHDGRVESLCIVDDVHQWGKYKELERKLEIHPEKQPEDICLFSLASTKTIENNGVVHLVSKAELPEKADTLISAVFRY